VRCGSSGTYWPPDKQWLSVTIDGMDIVEASEDLTAALGEDLDSLCSLLPVRWGPCDVIVRQVALVDGRPVGQVTVLKDSLSAEVRGLLAANGIDEGSIAECADLVVRSSFRKQGVGRDLLQSVTAAARERGVRLVAVVTTSSPDARRTFLGNGWAELELPHGDSVMLGPVLPG